MEVDVIAPSQDSVAPVIGKYRFLETIGKGAFGKVKLAMDSHRQYAIKIFKKCNMTDAQRTATEHEIQNLHRVTGHANIIGLSEVFEDEKRIYIVMEFAVNGEVHEYIDFAMEGFEGNALFWFRQLITGIAHCHQRGYIISSAILLISSVSVIVISSRKIYFLTNIII